MSDSAIQDVLKDIFALQKKQSNDIVEIKTCLLGDDYHPDGLVSQVTANKDCIDHMKRTEIPNIEKSIASKSGIVGGVVSFIMVAATSAISYFIFRK